MKTLPIIVSLCLTACAATPPPPLPSTHPASPAAAEGARRDSHVSLQADAATRKTRALLSVAHQEQTTWNEKGPVSGAASDEAKPTPKP